MPESKTGLEFYYSQSKNRLKVTIYSATPAFFSMFTVILRLTTIEKYKFGNSFSPVTYFERWECLKLQLSVLPVDEVFPIVGMWYRLLPQRFPMMQWSRWSRATFLVWNSVWSPIWGCFDFLMCGPLNQWILCSWTRLPRTGTYFHTGTQYTNVRCFCIKMCIEWVNYNFLGTF